MTSGKNAVEQFRENCMIEALNPDKFQTTIKDEKHSGLICIDLNIYHHTIKSIPTIKLSEIYLDDNSKFNFHISSMCRIIEVYSEPRQHLRCSVLRK